MKKYLTLLAIAFMPMMAFSQRVTSNVIVELDTMVYSDPGSFRSPWRYSRSDSTLYRWDYATEEWKDFGTGSAFSYQLSPGENYDLGASTLEKYDFLFFYMPSPESPSTDTTVVTLPEVFNVGSRYLGKNLYFYGGGDAAQVNASAPCVIRTPDPGDDPGSDSDILRTDCDTIGTISRWDTLFTAETDQRFVRYSTVPTGEFMSYLRECEKAFNSNRAILRVPQPGDNIGGNTVQDFLSFFYFSPPTITLSISGGSIFEVGTSNSLTLSGSTTNNGNATLSAGLLQRTNPTPANTINSFGSSTSFSQIITYEPQQGGSADYTQLSYSFRATQDWSGSGETGTANSPTRTVNAVYPVLYGMSSTNLHSTGDPYTTLTKLVEQEGDKTVSFTGSGFIYFAFPASWSDNALSSIKDPNNFELLGSFTVADINVSSSGLTNDWTNVPYKIYKLNTTTTTNVDEYQFIR
jgi:hypothetical protein